MRKRYTLPGEGLRRQWLVTAGELLLIVLLTLLLGAALGLAVDADARRCADYESATGACDAEVAR